MNTFFRLCRYGFVGALNVLVNAVVLNLLMWITGVAKGQKVTAFVVIASLVGMTHSFFWNKYWVFKNKNREDIKKEYSKFFVVTGIVTIFYFLLMHFLINIVGAPANISSQLWANISLIIAIPFTFLGNYFGYKIWVFSSK